MIAAVILQRYVFRVPHLKTLEENIQRGTVRLVILSDITGADHVHDHRKVLFLRRCLVMQIKNKGQEQHRRSLVPERVLRLGALWRGVLEQVCHQPLNIVIVPKVNERIVAVGPVHIYKIQHTDLVPVLLQKSPCRR